MNIRSPGRRLPPKGAAIKKMTGSTMGFLLGAALWGTLAGCASERRHHERVYAPPPPPPRVYVQDDYVYYPAYEVYYSRSQRHYIYRDGSSWVSRPAPPRVAVEVLVASPSVPLNFHDAPSRHHATVVRQYPKQWAPPGPKPNHGQPYIPESRR